MRGKLAMPSVMAGIVRGLQRRFPIDDILLRSGDIYSRSSREVV